MGRPPHQDVSYEESWQARWRHAGLFRAVRRHDRPKWFIVELPPFANGRLHHLRCIGLFDDARTADAFAEAGFRC